MSVDDWSTFLFLGDLQTGMQRPKIAVDALDLSSFSVDELNKLIRDAQRTLDLREFEKGLEQAVNQYRTRDQRVIRL